MSWLLWIMLKWTQKYICLLETVVLSSSATYLEVGLQHHQFSSVTQSFLTLCNLMDCSTPVLPVHHQPQASLSITNSQSLLKLMSIKSVVPSNHVILCRPLLLLPSIFPSIRVFSNESVLCIRWPKYWSFSFSLSNEYSDWFPLGLTDLICSVQGTLKNLL